MIFFNQYKKIKTYLIKNFIMKLIKLKFARRIYKIIIIIYKIIININKLTNIKNLRNINNNNN